MRGARRAPWQSRERAGSMSPRGNLSIAVLACWGPQNDGEWKGLYQLMRSRCTLAKSASHGLRCELTGCESGKQLQSAGVGDAQLFGGEPARCLGKARDIVYAVGGQQLGRDDPLGRDGIPQSLALLCCAFFPHGHVVLLQNRHSSLSLYVEGQITLDCVSLRRFSTYAKCFLMASSAPSRRR